MTLTPETSPLDPAGTGSEFPGGDEGVLSHQAPGERVLGPKVPTVAEMLGRDNGPILEQGDGYQVGDSDDHPGPLGPDPERERVLGAHTNTTGEGGPEL